MTKVLYGKKQFTVETNDLTNHPDEQSNESVMPTKAVFRPRGCIKSCIGCLLFVILFWVILHLVLYFAGLFHPWSVWHPTRYKYSLVESHEMPNILELAGEWVIELPHYALIEDPSGMEGWEQTRIVLKEDWTCELHNVPLYMMLEWGYPSDQLQLEWKGRTFPGYWRPCPQHVTGAVNKNFVGFTIDWNFTKEELLANFHREGKNYHSPLILIWKIKENGKETYRLKIYNKDGIESMFKGDGVIFKRCEFPTDVPSSENTESNAQTDEN